MGNPYIRPNPSPNPSSVMGFISKPLFILAIAVAGCFLPFPSPSPSPNPSPEPTPVPITNPAKWVIVVEQTEERKPGSFSLLMRDTTFWNKIESECQVDFISYDYDSPAASKFKPIADSVGLPALILQDKDGKVLHKSNISLGTKESIRKIIDDSTINNSSR